MGYLRPQPLVRQQIFSQKQVHRKKTDLLQIAVMETKHACLRTMLYCCWPLCTKQESHLLVCCASGVCSDSSQIICLRECLLMRVTGVPFFPYVIAEANPCQWWGFTTGLCPSPDLSQCSWWHACTKIIPTWIWVSHCLGSDVGENCCAEEVSIPMSLSIPEWNTVMAW